MVPRNGKCQKPTAVPISLDSKLGATRRMVNRARVSLQSTLEILARLAGIMEHANPVCPSACTDRLCKQAGPLGNGPQMVKKQLPVFERSISAGMCVEDSHAGPFQRSCRAITISYF